MKFLRTKQLRQLGAYVSALAVFVFTAEYFFLDYRLSAVREAEAKISYTRAVQVTNQKISLEVQQFLSGNRTIAPQIVSMIEEQEQRLKTFSRGGLAEGTGVIIKPLSRLPRITFDALKENWDTYRKSVFLLVSAQSTTPVPGGTDSTLVNAQDAISVLASAQPASAKVRYEGLSLSLANWYDRLAEDLLEESERRTESYEDTKLFLLVLNFVLIGGVYYLFVSFVLNPLYTLKDNIAHLQKSEDFLPNEIGSVAATVNNTIENLRDATDFVTAIGEGNLSINYQETLDPEYRQGANKLADSLIEMQRKLKELNEEEEKRKWANEGIARFVGILRSSNDDLSLLGDRITSALVQYTRSNQGALYILNNENPSQPFLELVSLFAFDIKKYEQQRIKPGEGILGQTFLEKDTTYLTELPDEYVRITSGLGGATPKSILIVPLKADLEVYGLVELASFNAFAPHEIAFVEKLGETIASTLASVKAAQKNKQLISEFEFQTEQMRSQEEEMRQNMEELQATQEEISRKEKSYLERIATLESALAAGVDKNALEQMEKEYQLKEDEYRTKIAALQEEVNAAKGESEPWLRISELERTLKVQIETMKVAADAEELKKTGIQK